MLFKTDNVNNNVVVIDDDHSNDGNNDNLISGELNVNQLDYEFKCKTPDNNITNASDSNNIFISRNEKLITEETFKYSSIVMNMKEIEGVDDVKKNNIGSIKMNSDLDNDNTNISKLIIPDIFYKKSKTQLNANINDRDNNIHGCSNNLMTIKGNDHDEVDTKKKIVVDNDSIINGNIKDIVNDIGYNHSSNNNCNGNNDSDNNDNSNGYNYICISDSDITNQTPTDLKISNSATKNIIEYPPNFSLNDVRTNLFLRNENIDDRSTLDPVSPPSPHRTGLMSDKARLEIDAFNSAENGLIIAAVDDNSEDDKNDNDDNEKEDNYNDKFEINNSVNSLLLSTTSSSVSSSMMTTSLLPNSLDRVIMPKFHSYRTNQFLPFSMINDNERSNSCDIAIDSIILLLTPQEEQIRYRASARAFICRTVRNALKAKLFESGLHALSSFLPDDPIRFSLLLWRGNSTNWLSNLGDKLRSIEHQPIGMNLSGFSNSNTSTNTSLNSNFNLNSAVSNNMSMSMNSNNNNNLNNLGMFDDDAFNELNGLDVDNEPKPTGDHTISNINPSSNLGHSRIFFNIDVTAVEINPNGRSDLCFLALVEDISQLVGKKNLFKRSLLLIRGWWLYETSVYIGIPSKNLLSDPVLSMLVCAIFNQYHNVIHQPLQALCIFLAEYSDIKWSEVAITLQGVVSFHTSGILENQPWLREPLPSELITSSILQKHCDFYHMSSNSNNVSRASATPKVSGTGECTPFTLDTPISSDRHLSELPEGTPLAFFVVGSSATTTFENTAPSSVSATPYGSGTVPTAVIVAAAAAALLSEKVPLSFGSLPIKKLPSDSSHCYSPTAVRNFQKRVLNIVHPLTNANMISTSVTADRVLKISHILETGATELNKSLKLFNDNNYNKNDVNNNNNNNASDNNNNDDDNYNDNYNDNNEESGDISNINFSNNGDEGMRKDINNNVNQKTNENTNENENNRIKISPFDRFFRGIILRFSGGWRPDIFESSLPSCGNRATDGIEKDQIKLMSFSGLSGEGGNVPEVETGSKVSSRNRCLQSTLSDNNFMCPEYANYIRLTGPLSPFLLFHIRLFLSLFIYLTLNLPSPTHPSIHPFIYPLLYPFLPLFLSMTINLGFFLSFLTFSHL